MLHIIESLTSIIIEPPIHIKLIVWHATHVILSEANIMSLQKTGRGATKKNIGIAKSEAATQYACIVKTNRQHICYQTPVNDSQVPKAKHDKTTAWVEWGEMKVQAKRIVGPAVEVAN